MRTTTKAILRTSSRPGSFWASATPPGHNHDSAACSLTPSDVTAQVVSDYSTAFRVEPLRLLAGITRRVIHLGHPKTPTRQDGR